MSTHTLQLLDGKEVLATFAVDEQEFVHLNMTTTRPVPLTLALFKLHNAIIAGHTRLHYAHAAIKAAYNSPITTKLQAIVA